MTKQITWEIRFQQRGVLQSCRHTDCKLLIPGSHPNDMNIDINKAGCTSVHYCVETQYEASCIGWMLIEAIMIERQPVTVTMEATITR